MRVKVMIALSLLGSCLILVSCTVPAIWSEQREYLFEKWCAEQDSVKKYWELKRKEQENGKGETGTGKCHPESNQGGR